MLQTPLEHHFFFKKKKVDLIELEFLSLFSFIHVGPKAESSASWSHDQRTFSLPSTCTQPSSHSKNHKALGEKYPVWGSYFEEML